MFKAQTKKYDYSLDLDVDSTYEQHHRSHHSPAPLAATTPLNYPPLFTHDEHSQPNTHQSHPRPRANSVTGLKKNFDSKARNTQKQYEEGGKQSRKVFIGAELGPSYHKTNQKKEPISS